MKDFAPFADGEISFPPVEDREGLAEVQMFTGENGTGKTRVLAALMASLGNLNELQDRVRQDSGTRLEVSGWSDFWTEFNEEVELEWTFSNGAEHRAGSIPDQLLDQYSEVVAGAEDEGRKPFDPPPVGWAMAGTGVALISDQQVTAGEKVKPALLSESLSLNNPGGGSGLLQRLMNLRMGVALERDSNGSAPHRLEECLHALETAVGEITGSEFSLVIKTDKEIRLMAKWGEIEMYFSELPDGLRSLLNWVAGWVVLQLENFEQSVAPLEEPAILILDEPENHLHPAWQRKVLPAVQRLFPNAQLFVVTHSPFVVSSLNSGWIHRFTRAENRDVIVEPPLEAPEGDSYVSAVGGILGVAELYDPETENLLRKYRATRSEAMSNKPGKKEEAFQLADAIADRGTELGYMMKKEKVQLEKLLAETC